MVFCFREFQIHKMLSLEAIKTISSRGFSTQIRKQGRVIKTQQVKGIVKKTIIQYENINLLIIKFAPVAKVRPSVTLYPIKK